MTEPLIVDPDRLNTASKTLGRAASSLPAPLPQLSVPGTDPLSLAIAQGAVQVEAPMESPVDRNNIGLAVTHVALRFAGQSDDPASVNRTAAIRP